jgi:hypothetical protein
MSKKKRKSGHFCKICSEYKSNESFSGKGHAKHICKRCSKKPPSEQAADMTLNRLFNMPFRKLSPAEKSWLENRLHDQHEDVRTAVLEIYRLLYSEKCLIGEDVHNEETQEAITWNVVEVDYSNDTIQKTSGTNVYLPENVEELYWGFQEYFIPEDSEEEGFEEDMELQTGIDDLPF